MNKRCQPIPNKIKYCYYCGRDMFFTECLEVNIKIPLFELVKIWLDDNVQLFCCVCYDYCGIRRRRVNENM